LDLNIFTKVSFSSITSGTDKVEQHLVEQRLARIVGMIEGGIKCKISGTISLDNNGTTATRSVLGIISIAIIINSRDNCGIINCREDEGNNGIMVLNISLSNSDTIDTVKS
jgi:hypothetical protein